MNKHFSLLIFAFLLCLVIVVIAYEKRTEAPVVVSEPTSMSAQDLKLRVEHFSTNEAGEVAKFKTCQSDCEEIANKIYSSLEKLDSYGAMSPCGGAHLYLKAAKQIFQREIMNQVQGIKNMQQDPVFSKKIDKLEFNLKKLSKVDC